MTGYAELQVTTNFSFLRGASHARELVATAKALGLSAIAVTDRNTLAGVVRAYSAARDADLRFLVGARLDFADDTPSLLCYPTDRAAYGRLTKMLSAGQRRVEKGECQLHYQDLLEHGQGQILIAVPPLRFDADGFAEALARFTRDFPKQVYLAATRLYGAQDAKRLHRLAELARSTGAPLVATGDVLYHHPSRRPLQDVLTCIREKCTVHDAGFRLEANAERHMKPPEEMARLFSTYPDAVARTQEIAARCTFSLSELRYEYPDEPVPPGKTPQQHLQDLTWAGAARRYPNGLPPEVEAQLRKELAFIEERKIPQYFLTVHDIVRWAREGEKEAGKKTEILCQGRGSAANSAVCYCLGVTAVDPTETKLLFERFLSKERSEPPDIDVDFEHERREEVIQYIYKRYGLERAAICATVIHYRSRSAIRDVGKALGLSDDITAALANTVWGSWSDDMPEAHVRQAGLDPHNEEVRRAVDLAKQLLDFPRHLSQHVGGFVLTKHRLDETVPIGNAAMEKRTFIEWDKDDIDELGLMKVDVLALGMLSCISRSFGFLADAKAISVGIASIPQNDKPVYDMLSRGDSVGVFQVESRAQMSMLPRLKPKNFYDLVIEVAIVRPGPIQGDMVHPYLRRRDGIEPVTYPSPAPEHGPVDELKQVLDRTLGVPLFQEQAMAVALTAAKFTPEEANGLRRAMATFRNVGTMHQYEDLFVSRMIERGYDPAFARKQFDQIKGFGSYGFPESHAASFAKLVYVSAWIKHHHPDVFCAAILNSQPMGFYQPAQLVRDAHEHGVEVRPPDVFASDWDCTLEDMGEELTAAREDFAPLLAGELSAKLTEGGAGVTSPLRPLRASPASVTSPASGGGKGSPPRKAVRLGLRLVDGLAEDEAKKIVAARQAGARTLEEIARRAGLARGVLERVAEADAFRSKSLDRRGALWRATGLQGERKIPSEAPLLEALTPAADSTNTDDLLPVMPLSEHVAEDYRTVGLSLKAHPCSFFRDALDRKRVAAAQDLERIDHGRKVRAAGLVLNRQRPGTAKNVMFATLEDETGIVNLVIWDRVFQAHRRVLMTSGFLLVEGEVQKASGVTHVIVERAFDLTGSLSKLRGEAGSVLEPMQPSRDFH